MRVYVTLSRIAIAFSCMWMAISVPTNALAIGPTEGAPQLVITEPSIPANLMNYTEYYSSADTPTPAQKEAAPALEVNCGPGCDPACGCDSGCGRWILGVEAVWLSPQQQIRPFTNYSVARASSPTSTDYRSDVVSGLFITPRIALGYQGECWGLQTRYWRMNEDNNTYVPAFGTSFDGYSSDNIFHAETVDLEATRLFCWRDWSNQLAFGVRYAQLEQAAGVNVSQEGNAGALLLGSAFSRHNIAGAGLTLGLSGYKPINGRCFNLFYNVRGSMVWDDCAFNQVETRASIISPEGSASSVNGAYASDSGDLFIGEIQVGAQWNFELVKNCSDAFVRFALEYQYWDSNDTGYAASTSTAFDSANRGTATAHSGDTRVDLIGFTVATGFTF